MLQFITHENERLGYIEGAKLALEGGCRWVQLRMKDATEADVLRVGREVCALCRAYGARFIVDDYVHLVDELGADGVHVGKNDMPVPEAREVLGAGRVIGGTANTIDDMLRLAAEGVDYIGLGPFRFTTTKKNLSATLGVEGYTSIMKDFRSAGYSIPVVAIGGITRDDVPAIMATGVDGIALSGTILNAANPVEETREIMNK